MDGIVRLGMMSRRMNVKIPKPKKQKDLTPRVDKLWSELVKIKAGYKCEYCGISTTLNSHHIFPIGNKATRWDLENGMCLCVSHHKFGKFSAHLSGMEFAEWVIEKRGIDWYTALRDRSREIVKHSRESKMAIMEDLKARIKEEG